MNLNFVTLNMKEMGDIKKFVAFLCIGTIMSCGKIERIDNETNNNVMKWGKDPVVCVIGIDGSGSYSNIEKAKNTVQSIIKTLPGESKVFVRWITGNSINDNNSIFSLILKKEKVNNNPYASEKQKKEVKKTNDYSKAVKDSINLLITHSKFPKSNKTDIYGFLAAATERFKNNDMKPVLIILSDMKDNTNKKYNNIDLTDSKVMVLDYQSDQYSIDNKDMWNNKLNEYGAEDVEFRTPDDFLTFKK